MPDVAAIHNTLSGAGLEEVTVEETPLGVICLAPPGRARAVLETLKGSEQQFDFLVDLFATDAGDHVLITYHLRSLSRGEELYVRAELPYDGTLASVWEVFSGALMPEREAAELFGLSLSGHPNPKRLLTTEGVEPLLLKRVEIRSAEEVRNR